MNRRNFLKNIGGAAAAPMLLSTAGAHAAASGPIQHIVVVTMENRSFDHLLGWFPNANGKQAGLSYTDNSGQIHNTYSLAPDWTGCGHPDPDHSYDGARLEVNNGAMDGFLKPTSNDIFSIGYYQEADFRFLPRFARNFTVCDAYFPALLGPTFPNRIFQFCGQTDRLDDSIPFCALPAIFDHLQSAGVRHKYYYCNIPFVAIFGLKYLPIADSYDQFLADCAAGTLPAVSFVDPSYTLLLNFANDDHPHSDMRNGDAFLAQTFNAVASSPNWMNTVFVLNFDEWGGFFETVPPPRALAPNNVDPDQVDGKTLLGCRVPCIVASPWTRGNPTNPTVNSTVFDHTSVLQLIESVFDVPPMAARETSGDVGNLLSAIDLGRRPQPAPTLPSPGSVFPQKVCLSSINPGGLSASVRTPFHRMADAGMFDGWPIRP